MNKKSLVLLLRKLQKSSEGFHILTMDKIQHSSNRNYPVLIQNLIVNWFKLLLDSWLDFSHQWSRFLFDSMIQPAEFPVYSSPPDVTQSHFCLWTAECLHRLHRITVNALILERNNKREGFVETSLKPNVCREVKARAFLVRLSKDGQTERCLFTSQVIIFQCSSNWTPS